MQILNNYVTYNGINTANYEIRVSGERTFGSPERDELAVSIPGRNGDVILDNGRWKNRTHEFECSIPLKFADNFEAFRSRIMASHGYHRLESTYHPDEFYIARLAGPIEPTVNIQMDVGEFALTFDRKPQRFLKSGEIPIGGEGFDDLTINNPTLFTSRPLLRCWTNGPADDTLYLSYKPEYASTPYVLHYTVLTTILSAALSSADYDAAVAAGLYVDIDCETGECFGVYESDGEDVVINLNPVFALTPDGELPELRPGVTNWITTLDGFQVIPRWFTI